MKKLEKASILITIVLISLLTLSAVSAAETEDIISDTTNKDVQTIDNTQTSITTDTGDTNKQIEKTEKKSILKSEKNEKNPIKTEVNKENTLKDTNEVKNFTDLNNSIQDKINNHEYVLELEDNYTSTYYENFKKGIIIDGSKISNENKTFTIKGKGEAKTIDANNNRIFNVINGAHLILENLKLQNGYVDDDNRFGGAIYVDFNSALTITNCTFIGNRAEWNGGAIYANKSSSITINNSTFKYNLACTTWGKGGAIYIKNSTATINNCIFDYNSALLGGAIYANESSTMTINNSIFNENYATNYGGSNYIDEDSSITIDNSIFNGNYAYNDGGAIYLKASSSVTIKNSMLRCNEANYYHNSKGKGGAIYSNGTLNVLKSIFYCNSAEEMKLSDDKTTYSYANAIYSNGTLNISNNIFADSNLGYMVIGPFTTSSDDIKEKAIEIIAKKGIMNNNIIITPYPYPDPEEHYNEYLYGEITGENNRFMTNEELLYTLYMTQSINNLTANITALETRIKELDTLNNNMTQLQTQIDTLSKNTELENQINQLTKKIDTLLKTNDKLQNQLKETNNRLTKVETKTGTNIKLVLKTTKLSKKSKKAIFTAKLKIKGKPGQNKIIIFTFRGKVFTAKTNKKGIAKVKLRKGTLQKLLKNIKPGEKVICQAKYGSKAAKVIKVKKTRQKIGK